MMTAEDLMVQLAGYADRSHYKSYRTFEITPQNQHLLSVLHIVAPNVKTIDIFTSGLIRLVNDNNYFAPWCIPPIGLKSLVTLNVKCANITELPCAALLPHSLKHIDCSNNKMTQLPNTLPPRLQSFICWGNNIAALPEILPDTLKQLDCHGNLITKLPRVLPAQLTDFRCDHNKLISIDAEIPATIQYLDVSYNQLTRIDLPASATIKALDISHNKLATLSALLPAALISINASHNELTTLDVPIPAALTKLNISNNQISFIGEKVLPACLTELYVDNNMLSKLPDVLPPHITKIRFYDNFNLHVLPDIPLTWDDRALHNMFDNIHMYSDEFVENYKFRQILSHQAFYASIMIKRRRFKQATNNQLLNDYINECNARLRAKERTAIINANGALWEAYMRRVMHPARFGAALLANPALDIEEYTAAYVADL
jgi:hypothetical protein